MDDDFGLLRQRVREAGLLNRAYASYLGLGVASFGILALGVGLIELAPGAAAVLVGFGSVQVALLGHDAGHLAVVNSRRANHVLASIAWTLTLGVSFAYWNDRHTRHHVTPNHPEADPDAQWRFGPALTPLMAITLRVEGWWFALTHKKIAELALLSISTGVWLFLAFEYGIVGFATIAVSQVLASLYLAAIVAPNHLGMAVWPRNASTPIPFLEQQLRCSRNLLPHPLANFLFGGLNYQIEHHLFPSMPRRNLARARELVKPFCSERGLPYTEESLAAVYRTVLTELPRLAQQRA